MAIPLYIDMTTGEGRTSLTGPVRQRMRFVVNDLIPLAIAFIQNGVNVTATVLADAAIMKVGVRAKPGQGSVLATVSTYDLGASEALVILPMDDDALVAYMAALPSTQNEAEFMLEVEVSDAGENFRCTYYQSPCIISREVNEAATTPPPPAP